MAHWSGQWGEPQSGPPYPGPLQPPHSAPPYSAPPYSAPPSAAPPYAAAPYPAGPPPQYPGIPPQPAPPPQPGPPRRSAWTTGLIVSAALVVVLAVAIVVVVAVRGGRSTDATGARESVAAGPVDQCLIGRWRQAEYTATFDLEQVGTVSLSGAGRKWTIRADGTADEDYSEARYGGTAPDGRRVETVFSGVARWNMRTSGGQVVLVNIDSTVRVTVSIAGAEVDRDDVTPHANPQPYTCQGNVWRTRSLVDDTASSRYERVA